jgi:hypothetical protein
MKKIIIVLCLLFTFVEITTFAQENEQNNEQEILSIKEIHNIMREDVKNEIAELYKACKTNSFFIILSAVLMGILGILLFFDAFNPPPYSDSDKRTSKFIVFMFIVSVIMACSTTYYRDKKIKPKVIEITGDELTFGVIRYLGDDDTIKKWEKIKKKIKLNKKDMEKLLFEGISDE